MNFRLIRTLGLATAFCLTFAALNPGSVAQAQARTKADDAKTKGDPEGAKKAIAKGIKAAQGGDLAAATDAIEEAVKLDPKDRQANFFLGAVLQMRATKEDDNKAKSAMMLRSAEAMRKLKGLNGSLTDQEKLLFAQATYGEASALALQGKPDQAIAALKDSVEAGFSDAKTLASNEDLASIRNRPEFATLADKVKIAAKKVEDAQKAQMAMMDEEIAKEILPKLKTELKEFKPFPFSFTLPDLNGKDVKLADTKGKVVIVDVWGTWCPPCRMEIPHFLALREKYKDKGFDVIGINYENGPKAGHKKLIESFAKENGVTYTCLIGDDKTREQIPDFQGFPTTLFLDRTGKVCYKHVGYAPMSVLDEIVKTLLADDAGKAASR
jgi:thiol-disulfide isomerase/thioredoxin